MDFKEFKKKASRTLPKLDSTKLDLAHMIMGVTSELNEVEDAINKNDYVNISEELCDILWYMAGYDTIRNMNLFNISELLIKDKNEFNKMVVTSRLFFQIKPDRELKKLYKSASIFCDFVKKNVAYDREINLKNEMLLYGNLMECVINIFDFYNLDVDRSMDRLINKLITRYPDKYTNENALNRNLEAERKELEK